MKRTIIKWLVPLAGLGAVVFALSAPANAAVTKPAAPAAAAHLLTLNAASEAHLVQTTAGPEYSCSDPGAIWLDNTKTSAYLQDYGGHSNYDLVITESNPETSTQYCFAPATDGWELVQQGTNACISYDSSEGAYVTYNCQDSSWQAFTLGDESCSEPSGPCYYIFQDYLTQNCLTYNGVGYQVIDKAWWSADYQYWATYSGD